MASLTQNKKRVLFVNACVWPESRTERLARAVLDRLGGQIEELRLSGEDLRPLSWPMLQEREALVRAGDFSSPMFRFAHGFAAADEIVLAAPYWDFSFPAALKLYIESVTIRGLTFQYTPEGRPVGLCRAKRLVYVTTAGGPIVDQSFGFGYIQSLSRLFYGIPSVLCYQAENLDIVGADVEGILSTTLLKIKDDPALAETAL